MTYPEEDPPEPPAGEEAGLTFEDEEEGEIGLAGEGEGEETANEEEGLAKEEAGLAKEEAGLDGTNEPSDHDNEDRPQDGESTFFSDEKGNLKFVNVVVRQPCAIFWTFFVACIAFTFFLILIISKNGNPFSVSSGARSDCRRRLGSVHAR